MLTFSHSHEPIFRVRRAGDDPLDATFSQRPGLDNRWNDESFPALYCCCSVAVARAIVWDLWDFGALLPEDLPARSRPRLFAIGWRGTVVDVASTEGIAALNLPPEYPANLDKSATRELARQWHEEGVGGVMARSASLHRLGLNHWPGDHAPWAEVAIFVRNCAYQPHLLDQPQEPDWWSRPA